MLEYICSLLDGARSPSGKAKVCKTFIVGSIPSRASNLPVSFRRQNAPAMQSGSAPLAKLAIPVHLVTTWQYAISEATLRFVSEIVWR